MAHYFISDLHLQAADKSKITALLNFLESISTQADALYILGDYFEYWIGDDDQQHGLAQVLQAMAKFAESTPLFFMRGNRDFLIGQDFAVQCNLQLLNDPQVIRINNQPILLTHGDLLCSDDQEYLRFREMTRTEDWQTSFLSKSIQERVAIAEDLRSKSRLAMQNKADSIMDVNTSTVLEYFNTHQVKLMIHGHTHRPAIHDYSEQQQTLKRFVLSDWHEHATYLKITDNEYEFVSNNFNDKGQLIR